MVTDKRDDNQDSNSIFSLYNTSEIQKAASIEQQQVSNHRQKEREKILARKERRATFDILPELRQYIKNLGKKEKIPASQFVSLALLRFMVDFESGKIDLSTMKQPSRSPRYDWNIVFPENLRQSILESAIGKNKLA